MDPRHLELAEPIPGPTTDRMQELAREPGSSWWRPSTKRPSRDDEVLIADLDFSVVPQIRNECGSSATAAPISTER